VTNLLGKNGLIGVNPGLAPGMSGGPVVLGWLGSVRNSALGESAENPVLCGDNRG
jgi:hypothetical protein